MNLERVEIKKTPLMRRVEATFAGEGRSLADLLRREYWEEKRSTNTMAATWGIPFKTVCRWMDFFGVEKRTPAEAQKLRFESPLAHRALSLAWTQRRRVGKPRLIEPKDAEERVEKCKKEKLRDLWQDPSKKAEMVAKMHNEKHRKSVKESWNRLSTEERQARLAKAREAHKRADQKRVAALEANYGQIVMQLVRDGLSRTEIVKTTGLARQEVERLLQAVGLQPVRGASFSREVVEQRKALVEKAVASGLMESWPERERLILERRYGLPGQPPPLEKLGIELGLTRQRLSQIERLALGKLPRI